MAELVESPKGQLIRGNNRGKKHSLKIDMTPMVDLGFLLVTFFIFTTTLSKANTMQLLMPSEPVDAINPHVPQHEVLILLMGKNNQVYCYNPRKGERIENMTRVGYGINGVRRVIQNEKRRVNSLTWAPGSKQARKLTVLIKPTTESTYANFVDILDEMNINDITRHITVDPDPQELEMIKTIEANAK